MRRVPSIRCTARRRDGQPCGKWAIRGGAVCPSHGGRAPQVRAAAQLRLARSGDEALEELRHLLQHRSGHIRLQAATEILDRVGLTARPIDPRAIDGAVDPDVERLMTFYKEQADAARAVEAAEAAERAARRNLREPLIRDAYWEWRDAQVGDASMGPQPRPNPKRMPTTGIESEPA